MNDRPTEGDDHFEERLYEALVRTGREFWGRLGAEDEPATVNGAGRNFDGTFSMLKHRRFYADGLRNVAPDQFYDLVRRIAFLEAL